MKKAILLACATVMLVACIRMSLDDKIYQHTREFTKSACPKRMDKYTMLDSMVYSRQGRVMSYYYTVSDAMDTDSIYTSKIRDIFDASLINNIRQNASLTELKEHKVTFTYIYTSKATGKKYMTFTYKPEQYQTASK